MTYGLTVKNRSVQSPPISALNIRLNLSRWEDRGVIV
jgi:hypothetical protein